MTGSTGLRPLPQRLETARLVLTPETPADADGPAELFTARGRGAVTRGEALERIAAMEAGFAATGIGVLVLRRRENDEPLGYCGLVVGRSSVAAPELAYELLPRAHGHGHATEAAREVLAAAFASGRGRIWSTVRAGNAPSSRVLEKLASTRHHSEFDGAGELVWLVRAADPGLTPTAAG